MALRLASQRATDTIDNDVGACAGRDPANTIGETFLRQINYIDEASACAFSAFAVLPAVDITLPALVPRELIGCIADRSSDAGDSTVLPSANPASPSVICAVR